MMGAVRALVKTSAGPGLELIDVPEPIKRDMTFHFVEHVEDVLEIALLEKAAAEQKTTDRAGRESHPLSEPEPAAHEHVPVGQA